MKRYELEKQSRGDHTYRDKFEVIATSVDYNALEMIASKVRLKCGVTYYQVLVINELDELGDIIDVSMVKQKR